MIENTPFSSLRVADVRRHVGEVPQTVGAETPLSELPRWLALRPCRSRVFVVDGNEHVVGAVNAGRLAAVLFPVEAAAQNCDGVTPPRLEGTAAVNVRDVMGPAPTCVRESTSAAELVSLLIRERVSEAPVVDADGRLIGQVDLTQVLLACMPSGTE